MRRRKCVTLPTMLGKWTPRAILVLLWLMLPMGHVGAQSSSENLAMLCGSNDPSHRGACGLYVSGFLSGMDMAEAHFLAYLDVPGVNLNPRLFDTLTQICIPDNLPQIHVIEAVQAYINDSNAADTPDFTPFLIMNALKSEFAC